jgi:hypothetical protein
MFVNTIFSVVIGLLFVFFVCSLAVSGMNEAVRKALNTRSKTLWTAIERILSEDAAAPQDPGITARIGDAPTRTDVLPTGAGPAADAAHVPLFDQLFHHPIIGRLDPARLNRPTKISHIPPADFARAMVDLLTPDVDGRKEWARIDEGIDRLPPALRSQFRLLYEEAGHDVLRFREAIGDWFESAMGRVSTWYKKRTRWAMLGYGALVAVGLNVSAINVTTELYSNDVVRATVVDLAAAEVADTGRQVAECTDRDCVKEEIGGLVDTGLPLLWRDCDHDAGYRACGFEDGWAVVGTVAGWLITAAALSLGAAFWFALLKRAFRLRSEVASTTG